MTNAKSTKRALITSALAILMCVAMLIGTTFAWFTDTASTGVNKIQAGNLHVEIQDENGKEIETLNWIAKDGRVQDDILWEPGATYTLTPFKIVNTGNLALKYKLVVTGLDGDSNLLDVIKFTYNLGDAALDLDAEGHLAANGKDGFETGLITVSAHMDEAAGNEYMDMTLDGVKITVYATQDTVENDSFGSDYDANAQYPVSVTANTAEAYNDAIQLVSAAGKNQTVSIQLSADIDGANAILTTASNSLSVNMKDKTIIIDKSAGSSNTETNGAQFLKGSTVLLENGTYKFADNNSDKRILIQNYSNLTLNNVTLDASDVYYALSTNCGNVTIKGNTNITVKTGGTALDIMHWENASYMKDGSHVVIDETMTGTIDGKIDVYCYSDSGRPVDDGGATLTIMGGTFKNSGLTPEQFKDFVATGYTVTTNPDGSFTVSK